MVVEEREVYIITEVKDRGGEEHESTASVHHFFYQIF